MKIERFKNKTSKDYQMEYFYCGTREKTFHRQKKSDYFTLPKPFQPTEEQPLSEEGFHGCEHESKDFRCILIFPYQIPNFLSIQYNPMPHRVDLPSILGDFLGLEDNQKIAILGVGDHLEIWLPQEYERYRRELRESGKKDQIFKELAKIELESLREKLQGP